MKKCYSLINIIGVIMLITSCTKGNDEKSFENPYGYFTIEEVEGEYVVVPETVVDASVFEQFVHNGGWAQGSPMRVTTEAVDEKPLVGSACVIWSFEEDGKTLVFSEPQDPSKPVNYRECTYSLQGNRLFMGNEDMGIICYMDSQKLVRVDRRNSGGWLLYIHGNVSDEMVDQYRQKCGL